MLLQGGGGGGSGSLLKREVSRKNGRKRDGIPLRKSRKSMYRGGGENNVKAIFKKEEKC